MKIIDGWIGTGNFINKDIRCNFTFQHHFIGNIFVKKAFSNQ